MARRRRGTAAEDALLVVQVWLVTRLMFAVLAVYLAVAWQRPLDRVIAQWDVAHFTLIARVGYADPKEMAFFPGWPLVLRGLSEVGVPMVYGGAIVALVCSLVAAFAVKRLAGTWGAIAWLLAPTAIFTAVPYTESPFCAAAFWAWERASQKKWGQAAVLAALACTLRVSGLFLIGALFILALTQPHKKRESVGVRVAWLLVPTAVLAAYVVYLYTLTGSWTAWFSAQDAGWNRGFHWPWEALANHWPTMWRPNLEHPEWPWVFRAELVSWIVGLVATLVALFRRRIAEASWVGVQVLAFSLSYWLMSVTRALLLWFPLWRQVGEFIESRPRTRGWITLGILALLASLALQLIWAFLYLTGRWSS